MATNGHSRKRSFPFEPDLPQQRCKSSTLHDCAIISEGYNQTESLPATTTHIGSPENRLLYSPEIVSPVAFEKLQEVQESAGKIDDQTPPGTQKDSDIGIDPANGAPEDVQPIYICPNCSFPCWLCKPKDLPADPDGFGNKEDEKMANKSETSSNVTSGSSGKRRRTDGLTYLGPKDAQFDLYILGAVGVFIGDFRRIWRPDDMPQDEVEDDPSLQSEVHLKIDKSAADKISDQVTQFHLRGYDETALTTTMIKYLAPFDAYVHRSGPAVVASLCREKWKLAKQGPTVPTTQGYTYDWEIVPDATYMVSVNMFEQDLREDLRTPTFAWVLAEPYGVAPYLTVEYKCSQKSGKDSEARSQIAVASMLWINERRKLKEALGTNPSDTTDLRHYSLIVNSLSFSIWLTKFNGKAYSVEQIDVGSFNFAEGVEKYVVWWNAIHKWGLGPNARSFKRDVELLWKKVDSPDLELTPPLTVEQ